MKIAIMIPPRFGGLGRGLATSLCADDQAPTLTLPQKGRGQIRSTPR
jgi:hypothetical protein